MNEFTRLQKAFFLLVAVVAAAWVVLRIGGGL